MSSTGPSTGAEVGANAGALHRLVVFGDVVGSGRLGMDEKRLTRAAMYEAFGEAYASVGIEPGTVHQEDRGDGILAALRPDVPPVCMVGRWIDTLRESLRAHNATSRRRLRLRVGMNAGLVLDDGRGLVGRAVDLACRLCDSAPARHVMTDAPDVDLLIVVSDWLYRNVVAEGGRYVEPDRYRRELVASKETREDAWFYVPGLPEPPMSRGGSGRSRATGTGHGVRPDLGRAARSGKGDPRTGGGTSRGDAPPPSDRPALTDGCGVTEPDRPKSGGNRWYRAGRDIQINEGNTIHGGFTGIRNGARDAAREDGRGAGAGHPGDIREEREPDWDDDPDPDPDRVGPDGHDGFADEDFDDFADSFENDGFENDGFENDGFENDGFDGAAGGGSEHPAREGRA